MFYVFPTILLDCCVKMLLSAVSVSVTPTSFWFPESYSNVHLSVRRCVFVNCVIIVHFVYKTAAAVRGCGSSHYG